MANLLFLDFVGYMLSAWLVKLHRKPGLVESDNSDTSAL